MKRLITLIGLALVFALTPLQAMAMDRITATIGGDAYLKEGSVGVGWRQVTSGVNIGSLALSGDRIALLDQGNGQKPVSIKEPNWNSPWNWTYFTDGSTPAASKMLVSQLSNGQYRLLVLLADGSVVMKDGVWNTGWWSGTIEPSGVADIVIGGDRIGIITTGGDFKVKQLTPGQFSHPNNTAWSLEASGVGAGKAALSNTRVAYIDSNKNAYAKEGGVDAPWFGNHAVIHSLSTAVRLAGTRICSLGTDIRTGVVECKEGSLDTVPTQTYSNDAADLQISQRRVVVRTTGQDVLVLEGPLYGANSGWQKIATNVSSIQVN